MPLLKSAYYTVAYVIQAYIHALSISVSVLYRSRITTVAERIFQCSLDWCQYKSNIAAKLSRTRSMNWCRPSRTATLWSWEGNRGAGLGRKWQPVDESMTSVTCGLSAL